MWGSSEALSLLKSNLSTGAAVSTGAAQTRVVNTFAIQRRDNEQLRATKAAGEADSEAKSTSLDPVAAFHATQRAARTTVMHVPLLQTPVPAIQTVFDAAQERSNTKRVVLDSGAFIGDARPERLGPEAEYYTIDEVVAEIKDSRSAHIFDSFPYPIKIAPVFQNSILAVAEASKETGDYYALSAVDRKIIALAYQLETGAHGMANIRQHTTDAASAAAAGVVNRATPAATAAAAAALAQKQHGTIAEDYDEDEDDEAAPARLVDDAPTAPFDADMFLSSTAEEYAEWAGIELVDPVAAAAAEAAAAAAAVAAAEEAKKKAEEEKAAKIAAAKAAAEAKKKADEEAAAAAAAAAAAGADGDDDGEWAPAPSTAKNAKRAAAKTKKPTSAPKALPGFGSDEWITPSLLKAAKAPAKPVAAPAAAAAAATAAAGPAPAPSKPIMPVAATPTDSSSAAGADESAGSRDSLPAHVTAKLPKSHSVVGCLTHDLSMQNVLLHMGLRVLTGHAALAVQRERRFVLRCSSCFTVCADMSRVFCPSCGGNTLFRAAVVTNGRGEESYRWREGFRQMSSKRGTRYSIPTPIGGRLGKIKDLKLREDVIPRPRRRDIRKAEARAEGIIASTAGGFDGVGSNFGHVREDKGYQVIVGYGRRNPNVVRK